MSAKHSDDTCYYNEEYILYVLRCGRETVPCQDKKLRNT